MLLLRAALALLTAHYLPGLLLVRLLGLGRNRLDRAVMAATLGGPLAAGLYLLPLVLDRPTLYWILLGLVDAAALVLLARRPLRSSPALPSSDLRALFLILAVVLVVEAAYIVSTGGLFRVDRSGNLVMDAALQRDTLFHVGLVRALQFSYPPELLSVAGVQANYHCGYHLQVAAWSRFFGIDAFDGIYRVGACWSLGLLVGSVFSLGVRLQRESRLAVASTALVFGSGLGYLFFNAPGAGFWSLVFLDAAVVSIFLPNPLLPAFALFFVGLATLHDYLEEKRTGALAGASLALASLLAVKVFLGVQALAALLGAALFARGETQRRLRRAAVAVALAASPLLTLLLHSATAANTALSWRPLEIARYAMEKLGWGEAVRVLAVVGSGEWRAGELGFALGLTVLWLAGFLGLRLLALPGLARDAISRDGSLRHLLSLFVLAGFAPALLLRIAPAEATGLSRGQAINDVLWFAAQSGIVMWFWTAEAVWRAGGRIGQVPAIALVLLVAFPATGQHFVYKRATPPDVVPAPAVDAARAARSLSAPAEVFLEPPDRVRPSLVAYAAGRPVVYDSYVDYDYMFVSRVETDFRRHALAQFWRSRDPGYACWFLRKYGVSWIYATPDFPLPSLARDWVEAHFANSAASLYRVATEKLPVDLRVARAGSIPMGLAGAHFFGKGWGPPEGSPRARRLAPGSASLFLPLDEGEGASLTFELEPAATRGEIRLRGADRGQPVDSGARAIRLDIARDVVRAGLNRIEIDWSGSQPLRVKGLRIE